MNHTNKEIRAAVDYAFGLGWRLRKAGPRAHIWGTPLCPRQARDGCQVRVYSTPRDPQDHAKNIRDEVDACPH